MKTVKLSEIFMVDEESLGYSKAELSELKLRKDFIERMDEQLELTYSEALHESVNLCFQNASELQPGYRCFFSKSDVINYLSKEINIHTLIPVSDEAVFPRNKSSFWKSILYVMPILLISVVGCNQENNDEDALMQLFQQEKELNCQLTSMKDSITVEWDNINNLLEGNLPKDMPTEEKNNILRVRNASLIRMFQSFDEVDDDIKIALNKTEKMDMDMTRRITILKKEALKLESEKLKFFKKLSQTMGPDKISRIKEINQKVLAENCR